MARHKHSAQHRRIADHAADRIREMVLSSLPRIDEAMKLKIGQASTTYTLTFKEDRAEHLVCQVEGRERIPIEPVEFRVAYNRNQLDLFDGDDEEEEAASGANGAAAEEASP